MATDDKDRQIAELTRRLDQEVGTLNRLIEITGLLNSTLNVDELLSMIMRSGADLLEAETSSLFLLDEERNELEIAVATGAPADRRDAEAHPGRHRHRGLGGRERGACRRRRSRERRSLLRRHRRGQRLPDAQPPRRAAAHEGAR